MDWTHSPPSILALGKGVGILLGVAFGSINSVKYGVRTYNDLTETPNMALAFPQEFAVVQFSHESESCPTCLFVDMDDHLLDYYGRPLSSEQISFAYESNLPQAMSSTTPLTVNFAAPSTPNSTGTYTTLPTPYAIPVSAAKSEPPFSPTPDTPYFEVGLSWLDVILHWWAFPLENIAFYFTNTRTSSGISAQLQGLAWLILWRLASATFSRAAVAWFHHLQKMRKFQRAKNAASKANSLLATEMNATQNAILKKFADIIHEYNHDPSTMMSAINGLLVAQYGGACTLKTASGGEARQSKETIDDVLKDTFRLGHDSEGALHDSPPREAKDLLLNLERSKWSEEKQALVAVIGDLRFQYYHSEQEVAANRDYFGTIESTMREKDERIEVLQDFAAQWLALQAHAKDRNLAVSNHPNSTTSNTKASLSAEVFNGRSDADLKNDRNVAIANHPASTTSTTQAPLSAEPFNGRSDAELENDPRWQMYLAWTAEENAKDEARAVSGEKHSEGGEVEGKSSTKDSGKQDDNDHGEAKESSIVHGNDHGEEEVSGIIDDNDHGGEGVSSIIDDNDCGEKEGSSIIDDNDCEEEERSNLEAKTAVTDISERNDCGRIDHQASPPEERDAQKGESVVHQDHRSKLTLSPARFDPRKQLLTARSTLTYVERQIRYLGDGHGTPEDPLAKPSSDIPRASTTTSNTGQTDEAAMARQLEDEKLAIWRKNRIAGFEKLVEKLKAKIASLEPIQGAVTGNAILSPARAEIHPEEVSATSKRALQRKLAKAKAKAKAQTAEEAAGAQNEAQS